jgi:hypothetical protein
MLTVTLPPDGYWYDCRIDGEHGFAANQAFVYPHTTLRVVVGNFSQGNWLDVDQFALNTYSTRITSTSSDPTGRPVKGPTCTKADVW